MVDQERQGAPPLVTTTALPVGPNDIFNPGIATLGFPGTVQLFGGELERDPFSGGRFTVGYSFDDCGEKAIELSGFFLGQRSASLVADSFATPVLARPFLRANDRVVLADGTVVGVGPAQSREFVSFPGQATGKVTVSAPSQLWGLEPSLVCKYCCGCDYRIDLLAGFRFLSLSESLSVREDVIFDTGLQRIDQNGVLVPSNLAGARAFVQDRFSTTNQFYGGQVGAEGRWQRDRFTVDGRAKLALGVTRQQLRVDGVTQINNDPQEAGGLLALPSNIGNFSRDCFSVIPQVGVSVGYFLSDQLRATAGYDFLYWSNVARPGGQIDPAIDVTAVPSFRRDPLNFLPAVPTRPAHVFKSTDFWAHGLTFGLEYRY
ncbi:MAG: BBP7 family outer membrane beta-barrel protein [Gemmataceae bacterium]